MEHLVPLSTAIGGALVGVLGSIFGYRLKRGKQGAESANAHLETFYKTMNGMMSSQEERHVRAIESLREEQREERVQMSQERKLWSDERQKLHDKIDVVQAEARKYQSALHEKEIEVAELRVEMRILTERLDGMTSGGVDTTVVVGAGS